jgi:ABC-2 type transport system permease protein
MIRAIRTELLKLRSSRPPWGLLGLVVGLSSLHNILFDSNAGGTGHTSIPSLTTYAGQSQAIWIPGEVLLIATVLGVIIASGEYRHRTATNTYLANPNRVRVMGAKAAAASVLGLLFGLASAVVATAIGLSFIASGGHHSLLSAATIARYGVGAIIGSAIFAAVGVALGSLIRSQIGAGITAFIWAFIIEQTIGGAFVPAQRFLPYTAGASLAGVKLGSESTSLPFGTALALVGAVALLISVVAARTSLTSDVA